MSNEYSDENCVNLYDRFGHHCACERIRHLDMRKQVKEGWQQPEKSSTEEGKQRHLGRGTRRNSFSDP